MGRHSRRLAAHPSRTRVCPLNAGACLHNGFAHWHELQRLFGCSRKVIVQCRQQQQQLNAGEHLQQSKQVKQVGSAHPFSCCHVVYSQVLHTRAVISSVDKSTDLSSQTRYAIACVISIHVAYWDHLKGSCMHADPDQTEGCIYRIWKRSIKCCYTPCKWLAESSRVTQIMCKASQR